MSDEQPASPMPSGNATGQTQQILSAFFEDAQKDETQQEIVDEDKPADTEQVDAAPTDEQPETDTPDDGASDPYTIAELAESLELDPAALYAAEVAMQDGTRVSVGSIKDKWQEAQQALKQQESEKQQFDSQIEQFNQQQQQFQQQAMAAQLSQPDAEEMQLHRDWDALNRAEQDRDYWDQAGKTDSGAAAMALQRVQQARQDLEKKIDSKVGQRQAQAQQLMTQYRQQSMNEVAARIPDWNDRAAYSKDWGEISSTMRQYGLTQPQIDTLWNQPALLHLMRDHVELRRKIAGANPKKKVVIPKNLRGGLRKSDASANKAKLDGVMERAKAGDRHAQTAAVKALMGGI